MIWQCWYVIDAYDSREMTLDWIQDFPLEINPEMELPQFDLIDQYMESKLQIYETGGKLKIYKSGLEWIKSTFLLINWFSHIVSSSPCNIPPATPKRELPY